MNETSEAKQTSETICVLIPLTIDNGRALVGRVQHDIPAGSLLAIAKATDLRPWLVRVIEQPNDESGLAIRSLHIDVGPPPGNWATKEPRPAVDTSEIGSER
ncbi:hypothetical protein [Novipirellula aureliae]|nr:hypothetical protein [Novipirellula aureliae]